MTRSGLAPVLVVLVVVVVVALAAPGRAAAQAPAARGTELYIAGKMLLENNVVIERVAADGKATEVFRGGAPTAWRWLDAHTLIELFDEASRGDAEIAWIVDGRPDPSHSIKVENASWPAEAQAWSQYLAVRGGQLWLVREPDAPRKGKKKPAKGKPAAPVYQRVDVKPHVVQREPPPDGIAARDAGRVWLDRLPSVAAPAALKVTRQKTRIARRNLGVVRCQPAKGKPTTFPGPATHPLLRIDVAAVRFVSPTLPLYVASGIATRPDGPAFDTVAFLGCAREPLHTLVWAGGDVFLTIAGAPGGAGFAAGDSRKMELWIDGRTVASLDVLLDPAVSPVGAAR